MRMCKQKLLLSFLFVSCLATCICAEEPYSFYTWNITYDIRYPFWVPQQAILVNNHMIGRVLNIDPNYNIVIHVYNKIDEPILFTWSGIHQRKNSWQDGTPGTCCPIPPGGYYKYKFQVIDQIGSYYYYLSTGLHRASGGYGALNVQSRDLIPLPFDKPEDEFSFVIGDWYNKNHSALKKILDGGKRSLGRPMGLLINGWPDDKLKIDNITFFSMQFGKTYRYRFCNVGLKESINVRIQGHTMKLVEIEGSHTVQNDYKSLDIHLGQCYSVLVKADQKPKDYYMVASTRFTKNVLTATSLIHYKGGRDPPSLDLPPPPPEDSSGIAWSMNQFRSFRLNLTASAGRPNPQGSYHYGKSKISRTIKIVNSAGTVDGKLRYALNGISHTDPETPLKLAEYFGVADKVFKYHQMPDEPAPGADLEKITVTPNVVNQTFGHFVEIIFENPEKSIQSYHLSGHSFYAVAIEPGKWSPEQRKKYNLVDAISRNSIQVYPNSWAAIMTKFDNPGMWNLRSNSLERNYLGQQLYISVLSPNVKDEYSIPDTNITCGIVKGLPKPPSYNASNTEN